jgi:hypothetical protein
MNRLSTAIICNTVTSYLRGTDGDLLREGVVLGVDLGVEPADKSPGGRESCLLRRVSFSSGTANNKKSISEPEHRVIIAPDEYRLSLSPLRYVNTIKDQTRQKKDHIQ